MPGKKLSSDTSQTLFAGGIFMVMLLGAVFFNLYLFAASPPWMTEISSFMERDERGGRIEVTEENAYRGMLGMSILNACAAALLWGLGYKVCRFMVRRPLRKAGFVSARLTLYGSWVFLIPFAIPSGIFGSMTCLMAVSSGRAQQHPWVLLNLLTPVAAIGVLTLLFPRPRVLEKVFRIIAPESYEEDQQSEEEDPGP